MGTEPKGFLIGRNPVNRSTGNGKTVACFLREIKAANLTQVYVTDLPIDFEICHQYYQISETRILSNSFSPKKKSLLCRREQSGGGEGGPGKSKAGVGALLKKILRSKTGVAIRNRFWRKNADALTTGMNEIIGTGKPDFVFYDAGNLYAEYELVLRLCRQNGLPLIVYVSDDYIYAKKPTRYQKRARASFEELIRYASSVIVISDAMKRHYESYLPARYIVAMNGCEKLEFAEKKRSECLKIVYAGNLGIGRLGVLERVISALQTMPEGSAFLEIYSSFPLAADQTEAINGSGVACFRGAVFGEELTGAWESADILIHVESFDKRYRDILSTAISTKISEYMCTGRAIFIVAPEYAESAGFVERIGAGTVVHSEKTEDIAAGIRSIADHPDQTQQKAARAKEYAYAYLTKDAVAERVFHAILDARKGNAEE